MKSGCTRSTSHKVASALSLVALTVDLFILNKLFQELDYDDALIYDAISMVLKLAIGFLTVFTDKTKVLDESISKQETHHNLFANDPIDGKLIYQLHAASCLLRLCTLLVSHKRRTACRCMTIMACLCSLVYVFARTHPLSHHLYRYPCAMIRPLPGYDRQIGHGEKVSNAVKTVFKDFCAHLLSYNAVGIIPILRIAAQHARSHNTKSLQWILFGCDVIINTAAVGGTILGVPLISPPEPGKLTSASSLRAVMGMGVVYFKYQPHALDVIDIIHLTAHMGAIASTFVAETQWSLKKKKLRTKEREPLSKKSNLYARYGLMLDIGLAALTAWLGKSAWVLRLSYAILKSTQCIRGLLYRRYQVPAVNKEDLENDDLPEVYRGLLEVYKSMILTPVPWPVISAACGSLLQLDESDNITVAIDVSCLVVSVISYWLSAGIIDHTHDTQNDEESQASLQTTSAGSQTVAESSSTRLETELDSDQAMISGVGADTTRADDGQRRIVAHVQPAPSRATTTSNEVHDTHANAETTTAEVPPTRDDRFIALLATLNDLLKKQDARDARQEARDARQEARDASLNDLLKKQEARDARQEARDASLQAILESMASYFRERITTTVADATSVETGTAGAGTQTTVLDHAINIAEH